MEINKVCIFMREFLENWMTLNRCLWGLICVVAYKRSVNEELNETHKILNFMG